MIAGEAARGVGMRSRQPELTVGTLGHPGHGKTTLTAALTQICAARGLGSAVPYEELAKARSAPRLDWWRLPVTEVRYQTQARRYLHLDCQGHPNPSRGLVYALFSLDGAILVVSSREGIQPGTRQQLRLARQVGVPKVL